MTDGNQQEDDRRHSVQRVEKIFERSRYELKDVITGDGVNLPTDEVLITVKTPGGDSSSSVSDPPKSGGEPPKPDAWNVTFTRNYWRPIRPSKIDEISDECVKKPLFAASTIQETIEELRQKVMENKRQLDGIEFVSGDEQSGYEAALYDLIHTEVFDQ